MKTLVHKTTGREVQLQGEDKYLELYLELGWEEKKADGPRKSRRSSSAPAKDADDSGDGKG